MTKNLLFLLAAAPLAAACVTSDDTGDDETTGDGDGDPTTGDGDGDPTTGDGDGDPTTGDGDGDGDGDPTTGDGDGDGLCNEYAALAAECYGSAVYDMALSYCTDSVATYAGYGADCLSAYEALLVCAVALDCEMLEDAEEICGDEADVLEEACQGSLLVGRFVVRRR